MGTPLTILLLLAVPAQPPAKADTRAEEEEARALGKKLTGEYAVTLEEASTKDKKLRLEPAPVFRWLLQLDRRFYGDVYVWTNDGRPEVIASITTVFGPTQKVETEIHSLSTGRPVMSHNDKPIWEPATAGLELKPLTDAPKPAATAAARLLQMRALAAQFSVSADYGGAKEAKEDLRLLAAPIYRYASASQGVTDGALFVYGRGTDPEAFLVLEAREKKKNDPEWQFAFVRFVGHASLRAVRAEREVWRVEKLSLKTNTDPKQPYFGLRKEVK